ncbi:MAG: hypothetical protein Q8O16_07665 [Dehalococcoidia bacterium]|nr:hypothetical protein [Dehalococcoidia bacterium]
MQDIAVQDKLLEFINDFGDDLSSLELLLFFGRHPHARFNRAAVAHALNIRRIDLVKSLRCLIDRKLVVTCVENDVTLYSLTRDASLQTLVLGLLDIGQHQWQLIAERIIQAYETV